MVSLGSPLLPDSTNATDGFEPTLPSDSLMRRLHSSMRGLTSPESTARLSQYGPNELTERKDNPLWREAVAQVTHPLALLLFGAAALSFVSSSSTLGWAILAVIALNAGFALQQERQAERSVEALRALVPQLATVVRDGASTTIPVAELVPGDVLIVSEGQRVSGDARVLDGEVQVDISTLNGESAPVTRSIRRSSPDMSLFECPDLLFSGTNCTAGTCHALVFATGNHTELGRIAALAQRGRRQDSPLERQVKQVARLIAIVAVVVGAAFLPLGLLAGLSLKDSFLFAVGLLVANVPEGLLPTITLALAAGVRVLARRGAVVKRLSAVETLGSTSVICTDKTGTITKNQMHPVGAWVMAGPVSLTDPNERDPLVRALAATAAACAVSSNGGARSADPTETAILEASQILMGSAAADDRTSRRHVYPFQSQVRMMSTVDTDGAATILNVKGAPESVLRQATTWLSDQGPHGLLEADRDRVLAANDDLAGHGYRVLAIARRRLDGTSWPEDRADAEKNLTFLGLIALLDPPREEVAPAVDTCHDAGIRINVITGDNPRTAAEIALRVGIGTNEHRVVVGAQIDALSDEGVAETFAAPYEVVCARSSPENKMRIAGALQGHGEVVAMTGDGVNDAPALQRADIGVAMGKGGTDVAREAATVVLTDDNFSSIVTAVEEGRRVYDNVRKFIVYIFAHAVPEVVPFLIFALAGGLVPLPLTVLLILAIDLGTETLPALALGREPAEPGLMSQPPRPAHQSIVTKRMLLRAWGILGLVSASLTMVAFFYTLHRGGWEPGDPTGPGSALHHTYLQATTATFAAIVACQIGTAMAARTDFASLRTVGVLTNRLLLGGIAFEILFAAAVIYVPWLNEMLATAPLPADVLAVILPCPIIVWSIDEIYRHRLRRRKGSKVPAGSV